MLQKVFVILVHVLVVTVVGAVQDLVRALRALEGVHGNRNWIEI